MEVIHGVLPPRIILGYTPKINAKVSDVVGNRITLKEINGAIDADVIGRYVSTSGGENNDPIDAKIIGFSGNDIFIDTFYGTGVTPKIDNYIGVWGKVIDLPIPQSTSYHFALEQRSYFDPNGNLHVHKIGWRFVCTVDFSDRISKDDFVRLEALLNSCEDFYFLPHRENVYIRYKMFLPLDYALTFSQRQHFKDHKGVVLSFVGIEKLTDINLSTLPSEVMGFGDFFGQIN